MCYISSEVGALRFVVSLRVADLSQMHELCYQLSLSVSCLYVCVYANVCATCALFFYFMFY